jgi:hypothetical protein
MNHIRSFDEFVNESGKAVSTPSSLEIAAGDVKVFADPQAENWAGETIRVKQYEKLKADFEKAIKADDDDRIRELLSISKDLPLFSQDKSQVWKMSQVEGIEKFRTEIDHRKFLAVYAVSKIMNFLDWSRNSEGKK